MAQWSGEQKEPCSGCWDSLLHAARNLFINKEFISWAARRPAGRWCSAVAPLWGCLPWTWLPHQKAYLLSMTDQCGCIRAWLPCPISEQGMWKEHDGNIGDMEVWGRGMWLDLSKWSQNVTISVSHVKVHWWVVLTKEEFKNEKDSMICSVHTKQPLFIAAPVITSWAHEQISRGGQERGW